MNTFFAASLFESPWVLLVIVVAGALSQWLMKRRQANEPDRRTDGDAPLPSRDTPQESSPRELDFEEALRQLLGGEPSPRAPHAPPIPPLMRDAQPAEVWSDSDEEQPQPEQRWVDEAQDTYEAGRPPAIQPAPSGPHSVLAQWSVPAITTSERHEQAIRRFEQPNAPGRNSATVVNTSRCRSPESTRAIGLLRDRRTVRQAFVASLVFGPPKAFER